MWDQQFILKWGIYESGKNDRGIVGLAISFSPAISQQIFRVLFL
jgi:hypothetical protein